MTSILDCTADCYKYIQQYYCKTMGESMPNMGGKPESTSAPIGQGPLPLSLSTQPILPRHPRHPDILTVPAPCPGLHNLGVETVRETRANQNLSTSS